MPTWDQTQTNEVVQKTAENLKEHGMAVNVVETKADALAWLKKNIPAKAAVMTGSSTTLNEIGFMDFLQSESGPWKNVQAEVWGEQDETKRNDLRREASTSEYFVASANAISQTGEIVSVDATGSRVGAYLFTAKHLILVVGTQKITPTLEDAMKRIREFVLPLEDKRAQAAYGVGSSTNKWVIIEREPTPDRITVIFVKEKLGF